MFENIKSMEQSCLLEFKTVPFLTCINSDAGSCAKQDLYTFRPDCGRGWFYLGPHATNNRDTVDFGIVVKACESEMLADIVGWQRIWSNEGGRSSSDFSLWRGISPSPDYVVIGDVFVCGNQPPKSNITKFMKAVHISACKPGSFGKTIWTDAGTRATDDAAIWEISNGNDFSGIAVGAFVATRGYTRTHRPVYLLNSTKMREG